MKKIISIFLAVILTFSCFSICVSATDFADEDYSKVEYSGKIYDLSNEYPWVFVHGMAGWGPDYEDIIYWGGCGDPVDVDMIQLLNTNGVEAYAAAVGPFSSAWDRACELYAQLTGTVVDYGEAHSKKHNHDRYGYDYTENILMDEAWDCNEPLNLVGHSLGGPTVRLFASLMAYGDDAEIAASGENVSALFAGGHEKCVNSIVTLSSVNNGTPAANLIYNSKPLMVMLTVILNIAGARLGNKALMWDLQFSHFGLTGKQDGTKATFSWEKIMNFVESGDNCGYDMTLKGAKELNERIKLSPYTKYYSYTSTAVDKTLLGTYVPKNTVFPLFTLFAYYLGSLEGKTIDGVYLDESWAINDGIIPLASALYPSNNADTAKSYEEAIANGEEIEGGRWYYMDTIDGIDHLDYCGTNDHPVSLEDFYFTMVETVNAH